MDGIVLQYHDAKGKRWFELSINSCMPWRFQMDTIIHEWAHIMTWTHRQTRKRHHADVWARSYGTLYRALIED